MPSWEWISLGVALVILLLVWRLPQAMIRRHARRSADQTETRERLGPELVDANPRDFTWLDLDYYDRTATSLVENGFRHLGDFENRTETRLTPFLRRFTRSLVSADGTITASIIMIRLRRFRLPPWLWWVPVKPVQMVGLQTEFDNGVRLVTGNIAGTAADVPVEGIVMQPLPPDSSPADILRAHRSTLQQIMANDASARPILVRDRGDILTSAMREHEWAKATGKYRQIQERVTEKVSRIGGLPEMYEAYVRERDRRQAIAESLAR